MMIIIITTKRQPLKYFIMTATSIKIHKKRGGEPCLSYADAGGGALWEDQLRESLKEGLSLRS